MREDILIVDDSLTVRMDLLNLFREAGLGAEACSTGTAARHLLSERKFGLLVLDILLPDIDGVELLSEIRGTERLSKLPIILLSNDPALRERLGAQGRSADEYVGKPYDPAYLLARAEALLAGERRTAGGARDTVLLVDDSPTFRAIMKPVLLDADFDVLEAESGEEALAIAAERRPSAIIVDGILPGIDGSTVIRRIRLDAALRLTPCLLLTASDDRNDELHALDAGADAFARKDCELSVIIARFSAMLRTASGSSEEMNTESLMRQKTVLAVDDSATFRHEIARLLRERGFQVLVAKSGEEALTLLSDVAVDCILLDLIMPGMGGQEACRLIKATPILRGIPVIMLTSAQDSRSMIDGLSAGADDFIDKANDFEILHARIMAQIRRKQFEDENRMIREKLLRKELEAKEAHAEKEAQYGRMLHDIVDALPDATILINRSGDIVFSSNQTMRMFGYRADELDCQPSAILFSDNSPPLTALLAEADAPQQELHPIKTVFEVTCVQSSGRTFPAEVSQSLLKGADGTYVISTIRDCSRRHLLEEEVKAIEVAKRTSAAKSRFLASMSHEIRTPLNGIIGTLELLGQTHLDPEQLELVSQSDRAAKSLLTLIGNILDFSKIEAGKLSLEICDLNPAELVLNAIEMLQSVARQKGIFITALFGAQVPSIIRSDPARITQILVNLIGNAVKFTSQGGIELKIDTRSWDHEVCELCFEVQDSGPGFDPALSERLFEPFEQSATPGRLVEGTGLGLAICRSLIDAFGGTIGCRGVPGEGATFWFTLPASVVQRAEPVPRPDLTGRRVALLGRAAQDPDGLDSYFEERGALVSKQAEIGSGLAMLASEETAGRSFDIAVIAEADGAAMELGGLAAQLRELHAVPLLASSGEGTRHASLRQEFAVRLPHRTREAPDLRDHFLDRNIRVLLGQAPLAGRDRFTELQAAIERDYAPRLAGRRLLVLEDRLVNQFVIDKQLKKLKILSTMVPDGIRGLETLESERFDLILCDCSMPRMNGFEFTREWRQREARSPERGRTPIIALTANAFREDIERCYEAGMDDFVSKPVTLDRLTEVLVNWLCRAGEATGRIEGKGPEAEEAATPVDLHALGEMIGCHDRAPLIEILREFGMAAKDSLRQLHSALEAGAREAIRDAAHAAKGEARSAGAKALAGLFAEIEDCADTGALAQITALANAAATEIDRVRDFVEIVETSAG